jgi:hypothetical protein
MEFCKVDTYPTNISIWQFSIFEKWTLILQGIDFCKSGKYPKPLGEKAVFKQWDFAKWTLILQGFDFRNSGKLPTIR